MSVTAEVAVSGTAYSFDMLFSYSVPANMALSEGCRVLVPFGRGNQRRVGVVIRLGDKSSAGLKPVIAQIDNKPVISAEQLKIAEYLHEYTFCTYFDAVRAMLPPAMSIRAKEHFSLAKNFTDSEILSEKAVELLEILKSIDSDSLLTEYLTNYISENGRLYVDELLDSEAVKSANDFRQAVGDATMKMIRLSDLYIRNPDKFSLTPKQKKAVEFLQEYGSAGISEVAYMCGFTVSVIKRLILSGAVEEYETEVLRSVWDGDEEHIDISATVLSEEQQNAYDRVFAGITENKPSVFLLHGVTGSGKTSVFEKLIDSTIKIGRRVIMLIPEISLTPQVMHRFRSLFGEKIAVIHSGLSLGQRLDEYKRIRRGDADIVIGTRSAVFAPVENIGLIIIDEEGERTYKSDISPRYLAHNVAKQRCAHNNSVLLLASATPSIESYYFAQKGIYNLIEMKNRYGTNVLPEVSVVDMTAERMDGNTSEFSRELADEINCNLQNGEQSILLLNRRGFHTIMSCRKCSQPVYCKNCSVPLTFHKKNGKMMCHYCGYASEVPEKCPQCGSDKLKVMGFGTQKLEEELNSAFPSARILRMDADTTFSRYSYENSFTAFRNGEYDIMVGTQMIGKGLDFPNVTLVGVLSVDSSLYSGDFRSYERTFSLITQVVGRGGRGGKKGRAVLQTFLPEHYVMNLAAEQNYTGFYNEEIAIRRMMIFPPLCDMCIFCISGEDEGAVETASGAVLMLMNERLRELQPKTPVRVLGPLKASHSKINGRYRRRIVMKFKNNPEMRRFISTVLREGAKLKEMKKITFYADINGDVGV
ncbi:MAG: primosomal protein N' [Ruminococcus flavefaciens]|nr:primosomal protein N' [Ruminococcus flavefaciens]MCM1229018.1 primosomal protein N' [Ruminococcus flavefaciens]